MNIKIKNITLLLIILLGLVPFGPVSAGSPAEGSLDGSLALLYASRSILLGEVDLEEANRAQDVLMSVQSEQENNAGEALDHLIHATKQQRNELNDSCRTLKAAYRAENKTCELQLLTDYCKAEEAKLNQRLGLLHKLRGDRRKFFTRLWHSLKRSGNRVWTAVGPIGRRILRNVGSEAAEVVLSGGSLGGGVIRKLVIKEARNVGEAELNRLLERGLGRFMQSQAALAVAAEVANCTAEKMEEARQQVAGDVGDPEIQTQPGSDDSCEANWWSTAYWEQNVLPELLASDKRCGSFGNYQRCMSERALEGDCPAEAVANCASVYDQILPTGSGKIVKIVDDQLHSHDNDNHFDITFSMSGGPVNGSVLIEYQTDYGDGDYCRVTVVKTFTGSFDPETCTLSGTAEAIQTHEESRNDICWGEPYERVENWTMVIRNGVLSSSDGLVSGGVTYGIK